MIDQREELHAIWEKGRRKAYARINSPGGVSQEKASYCVFSSHSFWTSMDVPARRKVRQDFSSTFFLRCTRCYGTVIQ